jgi:hypothetical protein
LWALTGKTDAESGKNWKLFCRFAEAIWQHFNWPGEFYFSDKRMVDSMGLAVPKNPVWMPD